MKLEQQEIARGVWVFSVPFRLMGIAIGQRMTAIQLEGGRLWVHSPLAPTPELQDRLGRLGEVKWVIAPNLYHHLNLSAFQKAYPSASYFAAPGLQKKRADFPFDAVLAPTHTATWMTEVQPYFLDGIPRVAEVLFWHSRSQTLIVTDLIFHFVPSAEWTSRLFGRLNSCFDRPGPSLLFRSMVRDEEALRRSLEPVLELDIQRIVLAHGDLITENAREALRLAWR